MSVVWCDGCIVKICAFQSALTSSLTAYYSSQRNYNMCYLIHCTQSFNKVYAVSCNSQCKKLHLWHRWNLNSCPKTTAVALRLRPLSHDVLSKYKIIFNYKLNLFKAFYKCFPLYTNWFCLLPMQELLFRA